MVMGAAKSSPISREATSSKFAGTISLVLTASPDAFHWRPWKCCAQHCAASRVDRLTITSWQGVSGLKLKPSQYLSNPACCNTASIMGLVKMSVGKPVMSTLYACAGGAAAFGAELGGSLSPSRVPSASASTGGSKPGGGESGTDATFASSPGGTTRPGGGAKPGGKAMRGAAAISLSLRCPDWADRVSTVARCFPTILKISKGR
mmetsp:Transcript_28751/g.61065  ORF Transcript_28751/g.61065 Transcript_28751/m.61065 type:complete len:205 (+) Transcript_28751:555-1169(+)